MVADRVESFNNSDMSQAGGRINVCWGRQSTLVFLERKGNKVIQKLLKNIIDLSIKT